MTFKLLLFAFFIFWLIYIFSFIARKDDFYYRMEENIGFLCYLEKIRKIRKREVKKNKR